MRLFLALLLAGSAFGIRPKVCPATGRGYAISYTFTYYFPEEHVTVVYPNLCSVEAQW